MKSGDESIERRLLEFIVEELLEQPPDGRDPLEADAVDSLGLEQLVDYIEGEFGIRIEDEEMVKENFASVAALASLVESKQRANSK